ncbi:MAG: sigma 54-interacting transcriptional regulator [Candidatus Margulisbacteria bacterium]|jgi:DNA-binding NtrC family response regulator|nr:sigma 54-interacting transcriptional regulator [Candidatus Margulisiibacteriota bacterium]
MTLAEQTEIIQELRPYFCGHSAALQDFLAQLEAQVRLDKPLFIYGLPGSGKRVLARLLHRLSPAAGRGFAELDLSRYAGAERETHLWTALKDIFPAGFKPPQYATVYVQGLAVADILFLISILEWLAEQKSAQGRSRVLVAVDSRELLESIPPEFFAKYALLQIPGLDERLADLPLIVEAVLDDLNRRHGTRLKYLENSLWAYFLRRGWSGNIDELRYNLEAVIFDLPLDRQDLRLTDLIKSAD